MKDTYTLRQAATRLNKSERTVRGMLTAGKLTGEKVAGPSGAEWRISVEAVERLASDLPHPLPEPPAPPDVDLPHPPAPLEGVLREGDLVKVESRLDRIEGLLAGQIVGDLVGELAGLREAATRSQEELGALREAVGDLVAEVQQMRAEPQGQGSWWGRVGAWVRRKLT
jgi:excisionase family DNA binding protein